MSEMQMQPLNEFGIHVRYGNKFDELRLYPEGPKVNLYVTIKDGDHHPEALMYLEPQEAMAIAKALEASAIEALREFKV